MNKNIVVRLAIMLSGMLAVSAHADTTIKVTTLLDENGSNGAACSLREALHVANDKGKQAFGGCPAASNVGDIIVQLEAGTYTLTAGELQVLGSVIIAGAETVVSDDEDTDDVDESLSPYTGTAPYRLAPSTIIDANLASRIVNSYGATGTSMTFRDVILRNGSTVYASNSGNGGAIYAAMSVALDNARIENSSALGQLDGSAYLGGKGGAIYLAKAGAGLSLSNATISGNSAEGTGGAIAMVCEENRDLATHAITISNTLMLGNDSVRGAGVVEACGAATVTFTNATISANASAANSGALRFLPTRSGQGSISLNNVTAIDNTGAPVLAVGMLASVSLNNSALLANFPGAASGVGTNCAVEAGVEFPTGNYNALDDASCADLLLPASSSTGHSNRNVTGAWSDEFLALGDHGGLTRVYLPKLTSPNILDKGQVLGSCGDDQRDFPRQSGTACDIGAAERQSATANDDSGDSARNADRAAVIDVLENDSFGETDAEATPTIPSSYRFASVDEDGVKAVTVVGDASGKCVFYDKDDTSVDEEYRNRLVINNNRTITPESSPISCTYYINVVPLAGGPVENDPAQLATVTANIKNISPTAKADVYVRPVGTQLIAIDVVANDEDVDDSNGGLAIPVMVPNPDQPNPSLPNHMIPKYAPIYINTKPQLGRLIGTEVACPDNSTSSPKTCLIPPLSYEAYNPQSPFTDSFQYSVYDEDNAISAAATVTIKTNAPDPDKGQTGGSLDLAGGLLLALLGLRRARKL